MSVSPYIECGKIVNTHGCNGGLKLESWCNAPHDLAALKTLFMEINGVMEPYKVIKASVFKQFVLVTLKQVDSMDLALTFKGKTVFAKRSDFKLSDGEYFIADLIGLSVIDEQSGRVYGTLRETINRGASDIYVVQTENGERMLPAVPEFVKRIDLQKGIFVQPIEGMLD
ncbi:MAG: 16S rRNA processing protein RimM [Ruminococcaceae bacterium]|nr:16S rRNA processing protein RimM [Oscillospiraceae bacterium]